MIIILVLNRGSNKKTAIYESMSTLINLTSRRSLIVARIPCKSENPLTGAKKRGGNPPPLKGFQNDIVFLTQTN